MLVPRHECTTIHRVAFIADAETSTVTRCSDTRLTRTMVKQASVPWRTATLTNGQPRASVKTLRAYSKSLADRLLFRELVNVSACGDWLQRWNDEGSTVFAHKRHGLV